MRKCTFLLALVLTALVFVGYAVAAGGDASDPLVSLDFLNGTFRRQAEERIDEAVTKADAGALNDAKAKKIYDVIDSTEFYKGTAVPEFRSNMNVTFRLGTEELEKKFVDEAKKLGMSSLKGHRSVGGIRATIYNAFPMEGVDALVQFMKDFEKANG